MGAWRQRRSDHREMACRISDDVVVDGAVQQQLTFAPWRGAAGDHVVTVWLNANHVEGGR